MADAAIPTGFTGLLITTRIVTDIYHLFAHQTRHAERSRAEPSGSERDGAVSKRITETILPMIVYYRSRVPIFGIRAPARAIVYVQRRKKRQKNSETNTSRERSVAERSEAERISLTLSLSPFLSLSLSLSL